MADSPKFDDLPVWDKAQAAFRKSAAETARSAERTALPEEDVDKLPLATLAGPDVVA